MGAVLTQAAAWRNVERAIANLKAVDGLSPSAIRSMDMRELADCVYPSGYYNAKSRKLKALAEFLGDEFGDNISRMRSVDTAALRRALLGVYGIGEETADAILLYALDKPSFVIDNYTRRLIQRLGIEPQGGSYSAYRRLFMDNLPECVDMFSEYHALIVQHCKDACRKTPICTACPLLSMCPTGQGVAG